MANHLDIRIFYFPVVSILLTGRVTSQLKTEVCNGEVFEADCNDNDVIVMDWAVYGLMSLGRCVDENLGYLGCHNDALPALDKKCSGSASCRVEISNGLRQDVPGACKKTLAGYAKVSFTCRKVFAVSTEHCRGQYIQVNAEHIAIASHVFHRVCQSGRSLKLASDPGQRMNISLWSFSSDRRQSYGTIRDEMSRNTAELHGASRHRYIMTTIGNKAEIDFNHIDLDNANFLIEIHVLGCKEISPPDGAWMTRDGDVMEIGCHSGSKTWSLRCEKNTWIGVLGQCGTDQSSEDKEVEGKEEAWTVSINVLLFGLCSIVILISACIFLAGVIVLKRKGATSTEEDFHLGAQTMRSRGDELLIPVQAGDGSNTLAYTGNTLQVSRLHPNTGIYNSLKMDHSRINHN